MPGSLSLWSALPWNLTENVGRLVVKLKEIVGGPRQIEKGGCHNKKVVKRLDPRSSHHKKNSFPRFSFIFFLLNPYEEMDVN